jgi:hypothetical protein
VLCAGGRPADRIRHEGAGACAPCRLCEAWPSPSSANWIGSHFTKEVEERGPSSWYHLVTHLSAYCQLGRAARYHLATCHSSAANLLLPPRCGTASAAQPRGERAGCGCSCRKNRAPASQWWGQNSAGSVHVGCFSCIVALSRCGAGCSQLSRGKGNELLDNLMHVCGSWPSRMWVYA